MTFMLVNYHKTDNVYARSGPGLIDLENFPRRALKKPSTGSVPLHLHLQQIFNHMTDDYGGSNCTRTFHSQTEPFQLKNRIN